MEACRVRIVALGNSAGRPSAPGNGGSATMDLNFDPVGTGASPPDRDAQSVGLVPSPAYENTDARLSFLVGENERLRNAVAVRDSFLAVAAHELRNPMTPILGRVTLLRRLVTREGFDPQDVALRLEALEASIVGFIKRATTLLDVSRIASDCVQVECVPVNVSRTVSLIADNLRPAAVHAGANIDCGPRQPHDVFALADPLALEQIIENLVSNAIKYGDGSPIRVVASELVDQKLARITVQDEGPGISPEKQARIFERFERAVVPGTSTIGYGVGLWLVRNLCDAMGGAIGIQSAPGSGSTFTVTLPLHIPKDDR